MNRITLLCLALVACGESKDHRATPFESAVVLVTSPDGLSGAISLIDVDSLDPVPLVETAGADAVGRAWFGTYFVINRGGSESADSVQVHDPANGFALVKEFSVGSTTDNAQDLCCVAPDRCYVPRLASSDLWIVDPTAADEFVDRIDLAGLTDDGKPNPNACHVAGQNLLVSIENLDDADPFLTAQDPGRLAVIDWATDDMADVFDTTVHNPFAGFVVEGDDSALVGEVGAWGALDGGWERIDLATGEPRGMVVTEEALGGDVGRLAVCSTGEAYAIAQVCDADFNCSTPLVPVDLETGEVGKPIFDPQAYALTWIAADDRGRLWVADRRTDGSPTGIWVYDCDGTRITEAPIDVGLPPAFEGVIQFL